MESRAYRRQVERDDRIELNNTHPRHKPNELSDDEDEEKRRVDGINA